MRYNISQKGVLCTFYPQKTACAFSVSSLINLVGVGLERRVYQCLPLILPNFFTKKSASYHTF